MGNILNWLHQAECLNWCGPCLDPPVTSSRQGLVLFCSRNLALFTPSIPYSVVLVGPWLLGPGCYGRQQESLKGKSLKLSARGMTRVQTSFNVLMWFFQTIFKVNLGPLADPELQKRGEQILDEIFEWPFLDISQKFLHFPKKFHLSPTISWWPFLVLDLFNFKCSVSSQGDRGAKHR